MAEERSQQHLGSVEDTPTTCQVAKIGLSVNAEHTVEIKPPPPGPRSTRKAKEEHRFVVQIKEEAYAFAIVADLNTIFDEGHFLEKADSPPLTMRGEAVRDHVCLGHMVCPLTFKVWNAFLYRHGNKVANMKYSPLRIHEIMRKLGRRVPKKHHTACRFLVHRSEYLPMRDEAVTLKIELKGLQMPTGVTPDGKDVVARNLISMEDTRSRMVADIAGYFNDDSQEGKSSKHFDFKIICKGEEIACHKFMLCARSTVLKMILSNRSKEAETGTIEIADSKPIAVRQFVRFLYSERIEKDANVNMLAMLLHLADKYDVDTLTKTCCSKLQSKMNRENASDILRLGRMYKLDLEEVAKEYVVGQAKEVIETDSWKELLHSDPDVANDIIKRLLK